MVTAGNSTQGPDENAKSTESPPQKTKRAFRITGIPNGKTRDELGQLVRQDLKCMEIMNASDPSPELSIYPSGISQVGIMVLNASENLLNEFIRFISAEEDRRYHIHWNNDDIFIDSHFEGLTPLNKCEQPKTDLIAITGLAGHAWGSWTHTKTRRMWLHDFLGKDDDLGAKIRIMTYGYDTRLQDVSNSTASMLDIIESFLREIELARRQDPTRPLIFVGHSLGGIIVTKALMTCYRPGKQDLMPIMEATKFLIFFGVPHGGMETSDYRLIVNATKHELQRKRMTKILEAIDHDSHSLDEYRDDMGTVLAPCTLISFYETQMSARLTKAADEVGCAHGKEYATRVFKDSSVTRQSNEKRIPVLKDHFNMAKFENTSNITYVNVLDGVKGFLKSQTEAQTKEVPESIFKTKTPQEDLVTERDSMPSGEYERYLDKLSQAQGAAFDSAIWEHYPLCLPKTRVDLLQEISIWFRSSAQKPSIFWLSGMAGTGKSTIARTLATRLSDDKRLGASFFFTKGKEDLDSARKFFTTIAFQLANNIPTLKPYVAEALNTRPDIHKKFMKEQWKHLIINPLTKLKNGLPQTFIVIIDALDECDKDADIHLILRLLAEANDLPTARLKVFVTSRPETPIRKSFRDMTRIHHRPLILQDIARDVVNDDIRLYFQDKLTDVEVQPEDIERLVDKANGLFLWAATACRFIEGAPMIRNKRLTLLLENVKSGKNPEKELDMIYTSILSESITGKNDEEDYKDVSDAFRKVVGSIVVLLNPLPMEGLSRLLGMGTKDVSNVLQDLHSVLDVPDDVTRPVRVFHLSFRDFLLSSKRFRDAHLQIREQQAHRDLLLHCLRCMSKMLRSDICNKKQPGITVDEIDQAVVKRSLPPETQYACRHWVDHLQRSDFVVNDEDEVHKFLQTHFIHWLEALSLMGDMADSIRAIQNIEILLSERKGNNGKIKNMVYDAKRFALSNRSMMKRFPLQGYCGGLIFSPTESSIRKQFNRSIPRWIKSTPKVKSYWDSLLNTLEGHGHAIKTLAFSPDGNILASGSEDNMIRLWDVATGESRGTLRHRHLTAVNTLAFSPDGKLLASGSERSRVWLWDVATGDSHSHLDYLIGVIILEFSPDGNLLTGRSRSGTVRLWDVATGACLRIHEGCLSKGDAMAFSPDGNLLAFGSEHGTVRLQDVATGDSRGTLKGHWSDVKILAFSPDGSLLASGSNDDTVRLWDVATGESHRTLEGHSSRVNMLAFSLDGDFASGSDDKVLWDVAARGYLNRHSGGVNTLVFTPDGKLLASGSNDGTVRLWDVATGDSRGTLEGHSSTVKILAFSPDGKLLASGSNDKTVRLWDSATGVPRGTLIGHLSTVNTLAFSPDGKLLASGSSDDTVQLWDTATGGTLDNHSGVVNTMEFSPDGNLLASGSNDGMVRLWDVATGDSRRTLQGHWSTVNTLAFSPNGNLLASGSNDGTVRLWDVTTGVSLRTLTGHWREVNTLAFSPDGKFLASGSWDKTVRLWDAATGVPRGTLIGHSSTVNKLAFSSDGKLLASASNDDTIRLWDMAARYNHIILEGYWSTVETLVFSPDGKFLATGSNDGMVRLWDAATGGYHGMLEDYSGDVSWLDLLIISEEWIFYGQEKVLFLPPEYRSALTRVYGNRIAWYTSIGRLCIMIIDIFGITKGMI